MLPPLQMGIFIFKHVFQSDHSGAYLEILPWSWGGEGTQRQNRDCPCKTTLLLPPPWGLSRGGRKMGWQSSQPLAESAQRLMPVTGHWRWRGASGLETLVEQAAVPCSDTQRQEMYWENATLSSVTWTWANSTRWRGTGRPDMLQSMGSQRAGHDEAAEQQQLFL